MNKNKIKIEYIPITKLKASSYNPRKIDQKSFDQLVESIKHFDLIDPIIVNGSPNRKNIVIGGHMRLRAAKHLGRETMPVVYVNISDIEEEKELNIRLNKNTGDWDYELLKSFDLDLLTDVGFDKIDLARFWDDDTNESKDDEFNVEKEQKEIKKTDIGLGDLLIMGQHKLLCADATDPNALKAVFGKDKASMIYSDPIYNIGLDYDKGVGNKASYGGTVDDNKSATEYKSFIKQTLEAALSVSNKNTHIFYWCDEAWVWVFQTLYNDLGIKNRRLNVWIKNNASPTPTVAFNKVTEFCVYGTKGSPYLSPHIRNCTEVVNPELGTGNDLLEDIRNVWTEKRLRASEYEHATSKPPQLHEKAIKRCTKPGDIILDSFSGSASTMVAAEKLKRRVYSTELEPIFCELARRRFESFTGKKTKLIKKFYEKA